MKPTPRLHFSLASLFVATFWMGVLFATALAMYQVHSAPSWRPWYNDRMLLWRQGGFNLLLGLAFGGLVGAFMHRYLLGPVAGLAAAVLVDVLCLVALGIWEGGGP
jgi:hypothetical protein